jgi:D-threo-aldose 1-dehydrogenase
MTESASTQHARKITIDCFVLGCSQLGGLYRPMSDADSERVLQAAWEAGVRRFDTAPHYGAGLSERRVGRFLSQFPREEFAVSTKVGRLLVDTDDDVEGEFNFFGGDRKRRVLDYSADGIRRSLDESLARLGLDRVDTLYVHDPEGSDLDTAIESGYVALRDLQRAGVVTHVGVGTTAVHPFDRFVRETGIDVAMLAGRYTLLDRTGLLALEQCARRGISVVAAGVYNSGLLAAPRRDATFDYSPASSALVGKVLRLKDHCDRAGLPLRAVAVQFTLRHRAVAEVAFGCRSPEQVADNLAMLLHPIPEAFWSELRLED